MKKVGANKTPLTIGKSSALNVVYSLMADTVSGVSRYVSDLSDFREFYEAKDGEDFYESLTNCGDDQVIVCHNVSVEWLEKIKAEYGIN